MNYTQDNIKLFPKKTILKDTYQRLVNLKPDGMFLDEFINDIIDHYMGTNCPHSKPQLYLKLPVKPNGCLDSEKCFQVIRDAHFGKGNPDIVEVCEDCLRMKRKFK